VNSGDDIEKTICVAGELRTHILFSNVSISEIIKTFALFLELRMNP